MKPSLDWVGSDGVAYLTDVAARRSGVLLGFSDRHGGVSRAPFDTLNLAARVGDDPAAVDENRARLAAAAGFALGSLALARQVHGCDVLHVATDERGVVGEADILVTDEHEVVLAILTADCTPVLIAGDPGVAVVHAGWRGLVAGAVERGVAAVGRVAAAWVGPSIHACCYEVGPEVVSAFRDAGLPIAAPDRVDPGRAAAFALHRAGVERVAASHECTSCDPRFFSYRRDRVTGRQAGFIAMVRD